RSCAWAGVRDSKAVSRTRRAKPTKILGVERGDLRERGKHMYSYRQCGSQSLEEKLPGPGGMRENRAPTGKRRQKEQMQGFSARRGRPIAGQGTAPHHLFGMEISPKNIGGPS